MFYLYAFCRLCLVAALLCFAQLIACPFFHPLLLVRNIQLPAFIDLFEALKTQARTYPLLLKPIERWCKVILQQFVIIVAAFIRLSDIKYPLLPVGKAHEI